MTEVTDRNFGYLVAYLIPGFLVLTAISPYSPALRMWMGTNPAEAPTVGGFFYVTLASVATGMMVSALRWLVLDSLHRWMGLRPPRLNFAALQANLGAFQGAVENHYRYYQHFGNTLVAILLSTAIRLPFWASFHFRTSLAAFLAASIVLLLFLASRDALRKYYDRTQYMLNDRPPHNTKERS